MTFDEWADVGIRCPRRPDGLNGYGSGRGGRSGGGSMYKRGDGSGGMGSMCVAAEPSGDGSGWGAGGGDWDGSGGRFSACGRIISVRR